MPERHLEIEREFVIGQAGKTVPPFGVVHRAGSASFYAVGGKRCSGFMPYATHVGAGCMGTQYVFDVLPLKPRLRHDDERVAALRGDGVEPAGFSDRITRFPFGLDVNRTDDVVISAVAIIIFGQVVVTDRSVVAVAKSDTRVVTQPRVIISGKIPQMPMGVDDLHSLSIALGVWGDAGVSLADPFLDTADVIKIVTAGLKVQDPVGRPFLVCVECTGDEIMSGQ